MNTLRSLKLAVLLISSITYSLSAQEPEYKKYDWEKIPVMHAISDSDKVHSSIVLKENHIIELAYNDNELVSYTLRHKIIKANTDDGIVQNNRIFLPFAESSKLIIAKARVLNSKGEIKELQQSDIKIGENNETKTTYHYFALDGLDLNSEIEYLFVYEQDAGYYGRSYTLQDELPKRNVEFAIITPANLTFISKSYNGLPELTASVISDEKNQLYVKVDSIKGIKPEQFATYDPNLMQVEYKLYGNKTQDRKNIINYSEAAQTIGGLVHEPVSKSITKELDKLIKKINITNVSQTDNTIREIENYIKKNIAVEEHVDQTYEKLQAILDYKSTNKLGITKLFAAIFDNLKIEYQIVLTTNRFETRFDPKFEAYNFLDEYLIYFPSINQYICPASAGYRMGLIPYQFFYNYGLFVKTVQIGEFKSNLGEIKFIEPTSFDVTKHNHSVKVDFSKSIDNPTFSYQLELAGYYAQSIQPYYSFSTPDQQKELDDLILKNMLTGVVVSDYSIENKGIDVLGVKPFIINASSNSTNIVDKAGNKYLFKLGELIGPQVEMYQEKEREFDVENDYNRSYYREITFTLPDDYKVTNPETLNMKVEMLKDGKPSCYFTSEYEVKDKNTYIVKVHEDYKDIYYPKDRFQEYREVINAAADFNKIVLILEKK